MFWRLCHNHFIMLFCIVRLVNTKKTCLSQICFQENYFYEREREREREREGGESSYYTLNNCDEDIRLILWNKRLFIRWKDAHSLERPEICMPWPVLTMMLLVCWTIQVVWYQNILNTVLSTVPTRVSCVFPVHSHISVWIGINVHSFIHVAMFRYVFCMDS